MTGAAVATFAADVREGLSRTPKTIPPRWFYDSLGSFLFEAITRLPWYPITRTERRLLAKNGGALLDGGPGPIRIVELGPGDGEKLETLLAAAAPAAADVHLVDLSGTALALARNRLGALSGVRVTGHQSAFEPGLHEALDGRPPSGSALVLFLGSNLGNFEPSAAAGFLREVRAALRAGDRFLLGVDLVKGEEELLLAYDDPLGVTAAFNRNLLLRIDTELGADFDPGAFAHRAVWNAGASRVEMWLVATRPMRVSIGGLGLDVDIAEGEGILTEWSYKYDRDALLRFVDATGFRTERVFEESGFALTLFQAR